MVCAKRRTSHVRARIAHTMEWLSVFELNSAYYEMHSILFVLDCTLFTVRNNNSVCIIISAFVAPSTGSRVTRFQFKNWLIDDKADAFLVLWSACSQHLTLTSFHRCRIRIFLAFLPEVGDRCVEIGIILMYYKDFGALRPYVVASGRPMRWNWNNIDVV